jgi:hypothetical protein
MYNQLGEAWSLSHSSLCFTPGEITGKKAYRCPIVGRLSTAGPPDHLNPSEWLNERDKVLPSLMEFSF